MWMMGCGDGEGFNNNIQEPFNNNGPRLRPLMPITAASTNPNRLTRIHGTDFLALNHHLAVMVEQNKRDLTTQQVVVSSRWNPTPEQLQTLEELYQRGTRTPSAEQIQHITAQLRRYGKIEGKNVFYWFQNHKARERQKRRRQVESLYEEQEIVTPNNNNNNRIEESEKKEPSSGANRTAYEVELAKNRASSKHSSTTIAERRSHISTQQGAKASDGWVQFEMDHELLQHRRNATWQMMNLSCSSSSPNNLIINSSSDPTVTSTTPTIVTATMEEQDILKNQDFVNICVAGQPSGGSGGDGGGAEAQTLELFPLRSSGRGCGNNNEYGGDNDEVEQTNVAMINMSGVTPYRFFEFLPLKN